MKYLKINEEASKKNYFNVEYLIHLSKRKKKIGKT